MNKKRAAAFAAAVVFAVYGAGCSHDEAPYIVNTFEITDTSLSEEYSESDELVTMIKYYEMSSGTWKTDEHEYKYRLILEGRMPNAARDSTFVVLSNRNDISFEQAYKSLISSSTNDFFDAEQTVIVAMK